MLTGGLPKQLDEFANKSEIKNPCRSFEASIPSDPVVNMVDSLVDITSEKNITQKNFHLRLKHCQKRINKLLLSKKNSLKYLK